MPKDGVWTGCGHEVKTAVLGNRSLDMRSIATFRETNKKDICYDCWKAEKGRSMERFEWEKQMRRRVGEAHREGFECPKCGGRMRAGGIDSWPSRIGCSACGHYYDVCEIPCLKCGSPNMIQRPDGSMKCPNEGICDYEQRPKEK
jgi:hypothetical protein